MTAPVVRVPGRADAAIDPELAAFMTSWARDGGLDGAELLGLAPNEPDDQTMREAS